MHSVANSVRILGQYLQGFFGTPHFLVTNTAFKYLLPNRVHNKTLKINRICLFRLKEIKKNQINIFEFLPALNLPRDSGREIKPDRFNRFHIYLIRKYMNNL